ncbi:MAG: hypothetical protein K0R15_1521 [Clostridiales bacterium]|jgi:hypothetical protein|nr:hypothetical protein [Clostridiales bacterium]
MLGKTKNKIKMYLAWNYDKEEEYINSMSKKGWQLKKGGLFHHSYEKNDTPYRYKIDFNTKVKMSFEEHCRYISIFEEQGWEYINSTINGWHYFRKLYVPGSSEEDYEIYTDNISLKEMLSRWTVIARFFQAFYLFYSILYISHYFKSKNTIYGMIALFTFLAFILFGVGIRIMKKKKAHPKVKLSKGYGVYLLVGTMLISFSLMLYLAIWGQYTYKIDYTSQINCYTEDFRDIFTVEKDGLYNLDIKCTSDRGLIMIQISKAGVIIYNGGGMGFRVSNMLLQLEKGEYTVDVIYYLEDYKEKFNASEEKLEELNLTGNLEEMSEVKILIGLKQ